MGGGERKSDTRLSINTSAITDSSQCSQRATTQAAANLRNPPPPSPLVNAMPARMHHRAASTALAAPALPSTCRQSQHHQALLHQSRHQNA
eukprot:6190978-Pleurochrysis_carterae.AAC.3